MEVYNSDDEQVEALKKWWNENGKSIIAGVILGLGAIFGWRAWQDYSRQQAEAASVLYQNLFEIIADDDKSDEIRVISDKIVDDYGATAFAVFTKLTQAKLAVEADDYEAATNHLRWALENNKEVSIEHLIRLRLARTLFSLQQFDEALTLLDINDKGEFSADYNETKGDILKLKGDVEAARASYQLAMIKKRAANLDISILEIKLDDLGRIEQ